MAKVPKENYSLSKIKEILNDDTIPSTNLVGGLLHKSNKLQGAGIDPNYAPGETNEERVIVMREDIDHDGELHGGYWRNYGPVAEGVEIHFANMVDRYGVEHIDIEGIDLTDKYILYYSYPPIESLNKYKTTNYDYNDKFGAVVGSYFNPNVPDDFGQHKLAIKIGFNQSNVDKTTIKFGIKVTAHLGADYDVSKEFVYESGTDSITKIPWVTAAGVSIPIIGAGVTTILNQGTIAALKGASDKLYYKIITKLGSAIGENSATALVGAVQGIAAFLAMIQLADMVMNFTEDLHQLDNGIYPYKELTQGLYNDLDIKDSTVSIGIGTKFNNNIKKYDIKQPFVPFETDSLNMNILGDRTSDYLNLEFIPKGIQYDVSVPPPMVNYTIELVAISGCQLASDKPIIIGVNMLPFKSEQPVFGIKPYKPPISEWNYGSIATFINAKYCDYIALRDLERDSGTFIGIIPTTSPFYHQYIGTWGNDGAGFDKNPRDIISKDLVLPIKPLFTLGNFLANPSLIGTICYDGRYEVIFAKDKFPQLIFNWEFINRQGSGSPFINQVKQYWELGEDWDISGGSLNKRGGSDNVTIQSVQTIESSPNYHVHQRKMYLIDMDVVVTNGQFYLDVRDTFYAYLYNDLLNDPIDAPEGITYDATAGRIYIQRSMRFYYIVQSLVDRNYINSSIRIGATVGATGKVNHCKAKRMSTLSALDGDRITPLANFNIVVNPKPIPKVLVLVFDTPYATSVSIDMTVPQMEHMYLGDIYSITVDWGDGSPTEVKTFININRDAYFTHNYISLGTRNVGITLKGYTNLESFTCNNVNLIGIKDPGDTLYNSILDLSNSSINRDYVIPIGRPGSPPPVGGRPTGKYTIFDALTKLKELNLSDCQYLKEDLSNFKINVTDRIDFTNSPITGDIGNLYDCKGTIILTDTKAFTYSGVCKLGCNYLNWTNTNGNTFIDEVSMGRLINSLYNSSVNNGTLYIDQLNAIISDNTIITQINSLINDRGWQIYYNSMNLSIVNNSLIYTEDDDSYSVHLEYNINSSLPGTNSGTVYFDVYDENNNLLETISSEFINQELGNLDLVKDFIFSHEITPEPSTNFIAIAFDDISNVPVNDPTSVTDWNNFIFWGGNSADTKINNVTVGGNNVLLWGITNMTFNQLIFANNPHIISFEDNGSIISMGYHQLSQMDNINVIVLEGLLEETSESNYAMNPSLLVVNLPKVKNIWHSAFSDSPRLVHINIASCIDLGSGQFDVLIGKDIELTINPVLLTNPEIISLRANNNVTLVMANMPTLQIGDKMGGGKIAYIYNPGDPGYVEGEQHGIIAQTYDVSSGIQWGNGEYIHTGINNPALGQGKINTDAIVGSQGFGYYAAKLAVDATDGGYSDWALPTRTEGEKLYLSKDIIGGYTVDNPYWTSTEIINDNNTAMYYAIAIPFGYSGFGAQNKNIPLPVRLIRYF